MSDGILAEMISQPSQISGSWQHFPNLFERNTGAAETPGDEQIAGRKIAILSQVLPGLIRMFSFLLSALGLGCPGSCTIQKPDGLRQVIPVG